LTISAEPSTASATAGELVRPESDILLGQREQISRVPWLSTLVLATLLLLGGVLGWSVSEGLERAQTRAELDASTSRVLTRLDDIIGEAHQAFAAIDATGNPQCSAAQLQEMRRQLFEARYLRDIGGVRGFSLYCSTALGVLSNPYHSGPPPIRLPDGTGIRTDRSVLASQRLRTMVVEYSAYNALIDSRQVIDLVTGFDHAHIELAVDHPEQRDWHPFSLLNVAQKTKLKDAPSARGQCSNATSLCARVRLNQTRAGTVQPQHVVIGGLGAALGASLFLIGAGVRRQKYTPDKALAQAIRAHSIKPYYQPIVQLPGGALVGFEALARWVDDNGRTVSTEKFIALAEKNGMISDISSLMIKAIGEEVGKWLADRPGLRLTLNVSPEEFCDPCLIDQIDRQLIKRGIAPQQIVLEITERTMIETEAAQRIIEKITAMGLTIYADDFGVGYCGLAYLNELDIHGIKISQQITAAVATDSPKASLVPRVTDMARDLGLEVIIEGIETEAQREAIAELEPIMVQGWLFARELSAADLMRYHETSIEHG